MPRTSIENAGNGITPGPNLSRSCDLAGFFPKTPRNHISGIRPSRDRIGCVILMSFLLSVVIEFQSLNIFSYS